MSFYPMYGLRQPEHYSFVRWLPVFLRSKRRTAHRTQRQWTPVVSFNLKHRSGHPDNCLFSLSKKILSGSKYPKCIWFTFEKVSIGNHQWCLFSWYMGCVTQNIIQLWDGKIVFISGIKPSDCTTRSAAVSSSASFSAEISLRSTRKLFIFSIYKSLFWIQVSKKIII